MSSHSLRPSIYLLSPYKLAFHNSPAWQIVSRIKPVTSGDFLYSHVICNMSIKESREPYQYTNFKHSQLISELIIENHIIVHLVFEYGRRLNSTVSNHSNNRKFFRMPRWFWQYLFHMQYEQERVEIDLSILEIQT